MSGGIPLGKQLHREMPQIAIKGIGNVPREERRGQNRTESAPNRPTPQSKLAAIWRFGRNEISRDQ